jgi:glycosyltransferase involved in cell wall biosynthesis
MIKFYLTRLYILIKYRKVNTIWVEKEVFPWLPYYIERLFFSKKKKIILDYDDAIFHQYDQFPLFIVRKLLCSKISKLVKCASLVIVGNEYLKNYVASSGAKKIELLPTVVDIDHYKKVYKNNSNITVGWIGSPSTSKYLYEISSVFHDIYNNNIKFVAIGSTNELLNGLPVEVFAWEEKTEIQMIQEFDIGIMPLTNNLFEKGKCGYKLIQYMACGKPVIASPVGINCKIVEHGVNGFLASTANEWKEFIITLSNNPDLRLKMGNAGRKSVEQQYSLQVIAPIITKLIYQILQN